MSRIDLMVPAVSWLLQLAVAAAHLRGRSGQRLRAFFDSTAEPPLLRVSMHEQSRDSLRWSRHGLCSWVEATDRSCCARSCCYNMFELRVCGSAALEREGKEKRNLLRRWSAAPARVASIGAAGDHPQADLGAGVPAAAARPPPRPLADLPSHRGFALYRRSP